jgi:hypothetical protein
MQLRRERSRRRFIAEVLGGVGFFAVLGSGRAGSASSSEAPGPDSLGLGDRRIAVLGERCFAESPRTARALARLALRELPPSCVFSSPKRRARLTRERLLDRARLAREFDREEVVEIDGWVLARSEAAAAVYLYTLTRDAARV